MQLAFGNFCAILLNFASTSRSYERLAVRSHSELEFLHAGESGASALPLGTNR